VYIMRIMTLINVSMHPITNVERLATELRKQRRVRKISQQALSEQAKVARRTITNAENAGNIGLKELCRIANALGCELALRPRDAVAYEELSTIFKDEG
jgi:transcriptional regulator with XRE-family HTH domain